MTTEEFVAFLESVKKPSLLDYLDPQFESPAQALERRIQWAQQNQSISQYKEEATFLVRNQSALRKIVGADEEEDDGPFSTPSLELLGTGLADEEPNDAFDPLRDPSGAHLFPSGPHGLSMLTDMFPSIGDDEEEIDEDAPTVTMSEAPLREEDFMAAVPRPAAPPAPAAPPPPKSVAPPPKPAAPPPPAPVSPPPEPVAPPPEPSVSAAPASQKAPPPKPTGSEPSQASKSSAAKKDSDSGSSSAVWLTLLVALLILGVILAIGGVVYTTL